MKETRTYHDPEDDSCPRQARIDRLIDYADHLRDEIRDRECEQEQEDES